MKGARSPVPRLDKLPTILNQEGSQTSVESVGAGHSVGSFSSVGPTHSIGSFTSASEARPHREDVPGAKVKHDSVAERLARTSLTQTYHHGKPVGPSLDLTPLSAILLSSNHGSHSTTKKASTHTGRLKSLLKERAASRGVSRLGLVEDPSRRASPEPQVVGSQSFGPPKERSEGAPVSPPPWAESPPPVSPDVSTASLPGVGLLSAGLPLVTEEDIQRAVRYFAGERDADNFTDEKLLDRTLPFYPGLTLKDARLLVGHGTMSADKLRKIVRIALQKDLGDFDPVAEAFKVLDPRGTGHADMDVLADMLASLPGIHRLSGEDRSFLLKISDIDGDGFMSENDFRRCSTFLPATPQDQAVAHMV